jgi:superfamily II DNA/RNA helicase
VKYVINFDFPQTFHPEVNYIHQCGRAGLLIGDEGESHTFMTSADAHKAQEIIDILKESKQVIQFRFSRGEE